MDEFIKNFVESMDDGFDEQVSKETVYKNLSCWSSMTALIVIMMVDEKYSVQIGNDELSETSTIEDLYNRVIGLKG